MSAVGKRVYNQQARAAAVEAIRCRILDAVDETFLPAPGSAFSLDQVADGAGTTVQTVLRHYGSKAGLIEAASLRGLSATRSGRDEVPVGDMTAVAEYLGRHYEEVAPMVLRMLAVEGQVPAVARISAEGRVMHRAWVKRVFAPQLPADRSDRRRRTAMFAAITDVTMWNLLRREQGLSRRAYVRTVEELLVSVT